MTVEVKDICKAFDGKPVLENVSFNIETDKCYVITGPSGVGKTTLLNILLGLEKPDSGSVNLLGDYKYPYLNTGAVFQEDRLCEGFSAVDNVAMVNKKLSRAVAREELSKLLPADALDKSVSALSGGMRRRVCIVRACIVPADILIMDEPFAGLDEETRRQAVTYIREKKSRKPLVLTAHSLQFLDFCREIRLQPLQV